MENLDHPIIIYDGDCGFCDRTVKWVLRHDHQHLFRFAALQGETATSLIGPPEGDPSEWSIVVVEGDQKFDRSTAALKIAQKIGWGSWLPALGLAIPRPLRDLVYKGIAHIRYRIFGKVKSCPIPSREIRELFLP